MSDLIWGIPGDLLVGDYFATAEAAPGSWAMGFTFIDRLREAGGGGEGELVCVLDTGIDQNHPEFAGRIADARSFVPGESVRDENGHGTHVAGTVGGRSPGVGVAGKVRFLVGKVLSNGGSGSSSWIEAGFRWGLAAGATGFSVSIGGPGFLSGMEPLFAEANAKGCWVSVAMGNEASAVNVRSSAVLVSAHDRAGRIANFSNFGSTPDVVGVAGPGVDIVSAWPGGGYRSISGTSMSTPFVAGTMSLFNSNRTKAGLKRWNSADFRRAFATRAVDAGAPGVDTRFGPGVLDGHFLRNLLVADPPEVR